VSGLAWAAFWQHLPALVAAIAVGVPGIIAAIYARRSIKVTEEGNNAADVARVAITKKIEDHNATAGMLMAKGLERREFERAIAIGVARATGNTRPNDLQ